MLVYLETCSARKIHNNQQTTTRFREIQNILCLEIVYVYYNYLSPPKPFPFSKLEIHKPRQKVPTVCYYPSGASRDSQIFLFFFRAPGNPLVAQSLTVIGFQKKHSVL